MEMGRLIRTNTEAKWWHISGVFAIALALLLGGIALLCIALRGYATWTEFADAFILELGIAFTIAALLALTIDGYMRAVARREHQEQQTQIEENIFRHLFGFGLNKAVVDELSET